MVMRQFSRFLAVTATLFCTIGASAQDAAQFRIGTGNLGGTYYPVGQLVADIISHSPQSPSCIARKECGVPGLSAVALTSLGSVANVEKISSGEINAAFVQSDVAYWAFSGSGIFANRSPHKSIRAVASLYPESIHVVARRSLRARSLEDLKNRVVALGAKASGTLVDTRLVLGAFGIDEGKDLKPLYFSPGVAAAKLNLGEIDAFFAVAGFPAADVSLAINSGQGQLMAIDGTAIEFLLLEHGFMSRGVIPAGVYGNQQDIPTIDVNALMIVSANSDATLIYNLTRALWQDSARKMLEAGHSKGKLVTLDTALDGIGIPLHPGAKRFYQEVGKIK